MRPLSLRRATGLLILALGAALAPGCVENRSSFFVVGVVPFGEGCTISPDTEATLVRGLYDISFGNPYFVNLQFGNQLQPLGDNDTLRTETSRIQLEEVFVTTQALSGGSQPPDARVPVVGLVETVASSDYGRGVTGFPAILADEVDPGSYLLTMQAFGTTLGGVEVETAEFTFPLEVCNGCLLSCDETFESSESAICSPGTNEILSCASLNVCNSGPCN